MLEKLDRFILPIVDHSILLVRAAYQEATSCILDRKFFLVDDAAFEAFERQLEATTPDRQKLKALLDRIAPWD